MKCGNCNTENENTRKYCMKCGRVISGAGIPAASTFDRLKQQSASAMDSFKKMTGYKSVEPAVSSLTATAANYSNKASVFRDVSAKELAVAREVFPKLNYIMTHCGINPVRSVTITNNGGAASQNLVLNITISPDDYGQSWSCNISELKSGESFIKKNIGLPLRVERLKKVVEQEKAYIKYEIKDAKEILYSQTDPIEILAYNEWIFTPEIISTLCAFVRPNSPAVNEIIKKSADFLKKNTGDSAFAGYQYQDKRRVIQMIDAIHQTINLNYKIQYINPPASFEQTGQKIRLAEDILEYRRGTCLDLTVFETALWEQIGLHPLIIVIPGHAFLGCWTVEKNFDRQVLKIGNNEQIADEFFGLIEKNEIIVLNSTTVCSTQELDAAVEEGMKILERTNSAGNEIFVIDVRACRKDIKPAP